MTFAFVTHVPTQKELYLQTVFLKKSPNNNTDNGKVYNSQSTTCQITQSQSLFHFAYHNINTANSLLPVVSTMNRLPHFQVSSHLDHHRTVNYR